MSVSHGHLRAGFSIVELLIVIVVIGILTAIGTLAYGAIQGNARDNSVMHDAEAVEAEVARYSLKNAGMLGSAIEWYSGGYSNPSIQFEPSQGNIIDVVASENSYCIRVYNTAASTYKTIFSAFEKGSSQDACTALPASAQAIADSPEDTTPATEVADIVVASVVNTGNSADDSASYTAPTISLTAGKFYLMAVYGRSTATPEPTITMGGVTWTKLASDTINSAARLTIFYAKPAADISSTFGISFGSTVQDGARWSVVELSGTVTSGTNGANAIVQYASAKNVDPLTVTMSSAPSHSKNVTIGFFARQASTAYAPASGFEQINAGGQGGPNMAITALYKTGSQTAALSGGVNTVGFAIEIAAAGSSEAPTLPTPDIAYKASTGGHTGSVNGGTVTLDVPSGVVDGDLLIANIIQINGTGSPATFSTPAGWTLITSQAVTSPNRLGQAIYYRIANSEPAHHNFSIPDDGSCCKMAGTMAAYSYVNTSSPVAGYATNSKTTSGTSVTYTSVTATADGYAVVLGGGRGASGSLGTPTTGSYTTRQSANTTAASWMNSFIADGEAVENGITLTPPTTVFGVNSSTLLVGVVVLRQAD